MTKKLIFAIKRSDLSKINPIRTFADNASVYLSRKAPSRGPLFCVWNITDRCNLRCSFCGDGLAKSSVRNSVVVSTAKRISIVRGLADAGVWYLSLCGGEPLLCDDICDVIKTAKRSGMVVSLSTNGIGLKDKALLLADAGLDLVTIGIDTHLPALADEMRGGKDVIESILDGLDSLGSIPRKKKIFTEVRCIVNRQNYENLDKTFRRFAPYIDSFVLKPLYVNDGLGFSAPSTMAFVPSDERSFSISFRSFLKKNKKLDTIYNREIETFIFHPQDLRKKYACFAGIFFCGLGESGELYACHEMPRAGFDEMQARPGVDVDFMEQWRSRYMEEVRNCLRRERPCDCWMDRFMLNIPIGRLLGVKL